MKPWGHFEYDSGSNPYIAFSREERNRILKKYEGRCELKCTMRGVEFYKIHDLDERGDTTWDSN